MKPSRSWPRCGRAGNCLKAKAEQLHDHLQGGLRQLQPIVIHRSSYIRTVPHADGWPTPAELSQLTEEFEQTKNRIEELNDLCRRWNIID